MSTLCDYQNWLDQTNFEHDTITNFYVPRVLDFNKNIQYMTLLKLSDNIKVVSLHKFN